MKASLARYEGNLKWPALVAVYASVPASLVAFVWLRHLGLVAVVPYWFMLVLLLVTGAANASAFRWWMTGEDDDRARLWLRLLVSALTTTAVVYATGWGSMLAIGYAVGSAEILRTTGSPSWRPGLVCNLVGILAGETAVALGIAPSMLAPGLSHAVAIAGAVCLLVVMRILGVTAAGAERAEERLREREEHFRSLVQHASDVIGVVDQAGVLTYVSPGVEPLLGYAPEHCVGHPLATFAPGDEVAHLEDLVGRVAAGPRRPVVEEVRLRDRHRRTRLVEMTCTRLPEGEGDRGIVVNLHDITQQRALEEQLTYDALHDPLTGLWNRSAFNDAVTRACARAQRHGSLVAVLFVDLDHFKAVNDTFGHDVGDRVLVEAADRLMGALRGDDVAGRLGGDEFTVLLEGVSDRGAPQAVARRLVAAFSRPWSSIAPDLAVTASVGLAVSRDPAESPGELLLRADRAMYRAKEHGRDRCECLDGQVVAVGSRAPASPRGDAVTDRQVS